MHKVCLPTSLLVRPIENNGAMFVSLSLSLSLLLAHFFVSFLGYCALWLRVLSAPLALL